MDDQLKTLYDYTKFHIGMYTTIMVAIIGIFSNDTLKSRYREMIPYMLVTIVLFSVAAMMGGLVASSIPFFKTFAGFSEANVGPWHYEWNWLTGRLATHIEHTAFWIGWAVAIYGLFVTTVLRKPDPVPDPPLPPEVYQPGA